MRINRYAEGTPYYQLDQDFLCRTGITGYQYSLPYSSTSGAVTIFRDGKLLIEKGYRWDGCSPKFSIFDMAFGTPEGTLSAASGKSKTYYASLAHDALYQLSEHTFSVNERALADWLFFEILRKEKFKAARLYYAVVKIFGRWLWCP